MNSNKHRIAVSIAAHAHSAKLGNWIPFRAEVMREFGAESLKKLEDVVRNSAHPKDDVYSAVIKLLS